MTSFQHDPLHNFSQHRLTNSEKSKKIFIMIIAVFACFFLSRRFLTRTNLYWLGMPFFFKIMFLKGLHSDNRRPKAGYPSKCLKQIFLSYCLTIDRSFANKRAILTRAEPMSRPLAEFSTFSVYIGFVRRAHRNFSCEKMKGVIRLRSLNYLCSVNCSVLQDTAFNIV